MRQAVLASRTSARPNCAGQFFRNRHYGCLPRICNASPRTSANCSLNSTSASSSSRSDSCKRPSLLRSISSWRRWSAFDGKCRFPTASTQSIGAATVEFITSSWDAKAWLSMAGGAPIYRGDPRPESCVSVDAPHFTPVLAHMPEKSIGRCAPPAVGEERVLGWTSMRTHFDRRYAKKLIPVYTSGKGF